MAEVGIGIAASISGLISLAGTISVKLYGFLESVADAPASIRASMILMDEMSMVLASIERLISGLTSIRGKRKDMIHVRHLVFIFRDLIQSFSELEATINSLNGGAATKSKINRLRWVMEEKKIATCVQRIEKQKEWLDTILLVLMCPSDSEALEHQASFETSVDLLATDHATAVGRLGPLDCFVGAEQASIKFIDDDRSTIQPPDPANGHGAAAEARGDLPVELESSPSPALRHPVVLSRRR